MTLSSRALRGPVLACITIMTFALVTVAGSRPASASTAVGNEIQNWLAVTCEKYGQSYNGFTEVGTDFCLAPDTPIYALEGGPVLGQGSYGGGGVISIEAAPGVAEYYQHLDCMYVHSGDTVSAGQLIGTSGGVVPGSGYPAPKCGLYSSSNYSGGPHIEWGINAPYFGMWNPQRWTPNVDPVPQNGSCGIPGHCLKDLENSSRPVHTAAALIPGQGASGYVLDGYGGVHPFGGAPAATNGPYWPGWDIARAIAVTCPDAGYVLDGYGGLHPFGSAPQLADSAYWGWDIARGVALCPGGQGGFVLDGYGGIHPVGNAPPLSASAYWPGWDIARAIVVNSSCTGGYVLDGYGGIHPFGNAPPLSGSAYWPGWDIARSITLVTDTSGYVLDGYGGIHPFAASGTPLPGPHPGLGYDASATDPFDTIAYNNTNGAVVTVTRSNTAGLFWTYAR